MQGIKRMLIGAVIVTTAAMTVIATGPAQAAPGKAGPDGAAAAKVDESRAPDRVVGANAVTADATAALATIQTRIARYVDTNGARYTFGSYVDPATGKIVVDTDAPASVVASLTNLSGAAAGQLRAASQIQVRQATATDAFNRRDDIPAYYGGGGIAVSGVGTCSSGYAVQNGAGTRFMVTAGHCFATGTTVMTESFLHTYGTVSNRHLPTVSGDAKDMELIGGQSYAGRIFTGGVLSSTSIPVVAAGTAFVGYTDYCHSGRTTGENCGHTATSINTQVCTSSGCKSPVIAFTGGTMIQPGDSGGTFYAKDASGAWIRGNVIATDGVTGWAEPWTVISPTLGVSIVLG